MQRTRLAYVSRTDIGLVRSRNEDSVAVHPELGLVVIADGMGGANSGDVASQLATDVVSQQVRDDTPDMQDSERARRALEDAVRGANTAIWTWAQTHKECGGMGTTVVAGFFADRWVAVAHVGDSRLYLLRNGKLEQVTRDHSFVQDVVDQGFFRSIDEARDYGIGGNILTRALGTMPQVNVTSNVLPFQYGDLFLFCTDGLSALVPDSWLEQILTLGGDKDLEIVASTLVEIACDRGGGDNITLVLARVDEE